MDHKGGHGVPSRFELRHGTDGLHFGRWGRGRQGGGGEAVEHHSETVTLLEEGEDEF